MPIAPKGSLRTLVAEYCPGPFYMGWHLYERERRDRRNHDYGWGWLNYGGSWPHIEAIYEMLVGLGHKPPVPQRYSDDFSEWFGKTFPKGIRVRIGYFCYEFVRVIRR